MRSGFAAIGVLFGAFVYLSIAFPNGVVESLRSGTAHVPTIETAGGVGALAFLLAFVAALIFALAILISIAAAVFRRDRLRDVADAYGVDVSALSGSPDEQESE